jgi:hypothetical protein
VSRRTSFVAAALVVCALAASPAGADVVADSARAVAQPADSAHAVAAPVDSGHATAAAPARAAATSPALPPPAAGEKPAQRDPSCTVFPIVPTAGVAVMRLPRGFIRAGSDSVWSRAGGWVRDRDYRLDRLRGDLRLLRAWVPGETLWVSVCGLLAPPGLEYVRQVYQPARPFGAKDTGAAAILPMPATSRPSTGRDPANAPSGSALAVNGNKTLAVDFGSTQDAALRQSLDLSLSGRIAPGVEITGVLSDRDTPLSAEGSTQDLQSLDRVLVEVKAKDGAGALGDIPVTLTRSEFGRLDRRVQGVAAEWHPGDFTVRAAAAGSQGVYNRLQFVGVDGLQGPYQLTDGDGNIGVTIVAGSEVVTVDGARMTRGEAADYAIDYDRARVTFSNRRPISSASRITVEYQYTLTRFRRNLAMFSSEWKHGAWSWYAQGITEGDDAGRPLSGALDATDRLQLAQAGDSLAVGNGVTPGVGDYDSVLVGTVSHFVFAGIDSGKFAVQFARIGDGRGDYADSGLVAGRTVYHYVGPGLGAFEVGRLLPSPMTQRLGAVGATLAAGGMRLDVEGAASYLDRNTLSALDDQDDLGGAGRVQVSSEGRLGILPGRAGLAAGFRAVDKRFAPFSKLEQPFAEEDWGLPTGADLEHQRRVDASAWWRLSTGTQVKGELAHLTTPDGFSGLRQRGDLQLQLSNLAFTGALLKAEGTSSEFAFPDGGRTRATGDVRWHGSWLSPSLRGDDDLRRTPSDTATVENRVRALDMDVASGTRIPFRFTVGAGTRLDALDAGHTSTSSRANTLRGELETPVTAPFGASITAQRQDTRDQQTGATIRHDLASTRLRGEWKPAGLTGSLQVERTGEAENQRFRKLTFVGNGLGSYDSTGNFVGTGDYALTLVVSPDLQRFARTATSARAAWAFGASEAWRGSHVEFTLEDEARRLGDGRLADVFLSTGLALVDTSLSLGTIAQRIEAELAPGSRAAAFRARAERRLSADRTVENFAQITDQRTGALRWRTRPSPGTSTEVEGTVNWQRAEQQIVGGASFSRTLIAEGGTAQFIWQPSGGLRLVGAAEADWSRPISQPEFTRTLRVGPDAGVSVGRGGRVELTVRRAFISGPPALALLPSADPAGAARWDGTARFDWRLHETTTLSLSSSVRERPGHATVTTGRAEVRAFF